MVFEIDDIIPFSIKHKGETIRQIIRYDSGYLKVLFLKDSRVVFSQKCFDELCRLTKGHFDNWEQPKEYTPNIFDSLRTYAKPFLVDFNDEELRRTNQQRLK